MIVKKKSYKLVEKVPPTPHHFFNGPSLKVWWAPPFSLYGSTPWYKVLFFSKFRKVFYSFSSPWPCCENVCLPRSEEKNLTKKLLRSFARSNWMTINGMIHRQRVIVYHFSRESERNGEGGKSHNLSNNSKLPFLFNIRVCVSGFISAVQMIRNVFSELVLSGTSAAWCLYRPDTPHSFLALRGIDYCNVIGSWSET